MGTSKDATPAAVPVNMRRRRDIGHSSAALMNGRPDRLSNIAANPKAICSRPKVALTPGAGVIPVTQECVAQMLGVRRTTLTVVARLMQSAGLMRYRRGRIEITNRTGLEENACECYGLLRRHIDHAFSATQPQTASPHSAPIRVAPQTLPDTAAQDRVRLPLHPR